MPCLSVETRMNETKSSIGIPGTATAQCQRGAFGEITTEEWFNSTLS